MTHTAGTVLFRPKAGRQPAKVQFFYVIQSFAILEHEVAYFNYYYNYDYQNHLAMPESILVC
ncbi:MAG: hypothetical protein HQL89_11420 [Magnetococcales bacterium]|nr:hypothetical protein [Magnetococcales bacterium]